MPSRPRDDQPGRGVQDMVQQRRVAEWNVTVPVTRPINDEAVMPSEKREADHGKHEIDDAERQHQQQIEHRRPGAHVGQRFLDARPGYHSSAADRWRQAARHAHAEQRFDDAPFDMAEHAHRADEQQRERQCR